MSTTLVIDLETTANGGPDGDSPEAHWGDCNVVLMAGWCWYNEDTGVRSKVYTGGLNALHRAIMDTEGPVHRIVGHNIKFDLKYYYREYGFLLPEMDIHDTMTYMYLNSGHTEKFPSLERACDYYGVETTGKTLDLGKYLDGGGKMEEIPVDDLREYLINDVKMTTDLFKAQSEQDEYYNMQYIAALADMELNGLLLDTDRTEKAAAGAACYYDEFVNNMKRDIMEVCEWKDGTEIVDTDFAKKIKPTAARTLSYLFTGYPEGVRTTSDKWTWQYKKGFEPYLDARDIGEIWPDTEHTHLGFPMNDDILERIKAGDYPTAAPVAGDLQTFRHYDKLLNTYYLPFLSKCDDKNRLHPKLNTAATATGRLSSSDPNGQNMPSDARSMITAPEGWELCELDFSQLELMALASLAGDKRMIADIKAGKDIHFESGKKVYGWVDESEMDKNTRKIVKNVNFGAVYGGKPPGLSKQTGIKQHIIKDLIDSLYSTYPGVAKWQRGFFEYVVDNMEPAGTDDTGEQKYKSTVWQGTRKYTFVEQPAPWWIKKKTGRKWCFSPNQVYNYPIQGFAGWFIVLQFLSFLWQKYRHSYRFLMTVHDSILMQVPKGLRHRSLVEHEIELALDLFMRDNPEILVPLKCDFEWDTHWS